WGRVEFSWIRAKTPPDPLFAAFLRRHLELRERVGPEALEVVAQSFDAGWVELVESSRPVRPIDDEMRPFEHLEVLRNRRPGHREIAREIANRDRTVEQPLDNGPSSPVAQSVHLGVWVSNH